MRTRTATAGSSESGSPIRRRQTRCSASRRTSKSSPGRSLRYLSLTERDREEMLAAVGVASVDDLFRDIPASLRLGRELDLEPPLGEQELTRHLEELASRNVDTMRELSFLGAGIYDHYVPAIVDAVLQRGELLTAYTPYQPELSQGVLQE